jgi:crotonobetainyl-CoA:carnitine CoA-transferase CaiB-like acyl-CoA transferase
VTGVAGALSGLRVLDISTLFAAPQIAAILGDFGADVVRVEPPGGDPLRRIGAQRNGQSLMWALVNRNKRAVRLDPGQPRGQVLLHRLLASFGVLIENQPSRLLEEWGCLPEELAERHPHLIVVSVTCYGRTGPYAGRPGAGTLAEAFGGLTFMTGEPDGPPMLPSIALGDTVTAMSGVIGTLAACYRRDTGHGDGQHVDVSMYEPILQLLAPTIAAYDPEGRVPARTGSRVAGGVPRNVYRTRDDHWIVVSATTDVQAARVLTLLGKDTPDGRARYGQSESRLQHADELDALFARWVAGHSRETVLALLLDARVPAAPVNDVAAILADQQVIARSDVTTLDDDRLGPLRMVAPVPRLSMTPGSIETAGPAIGADNRSVYGDLLGLSAAELDDLAAAGVI